MSGTSSKTERGFVKKAWSGHSRFHSKKDKVMAPAKVAAPCMLPLENQGDYTETKSAGEDWVGTRSYGAQDSVSQRLALSQSVDLDEDDTMDENELARALKLMGDVNLDAETGDPVAQTSDHKDRDKKIAKRRPLKMLTVNEIFDLLDEDKSGILNKDKVVYNRLRLEITEIEAANLFDDLDIDKKGTLSKQEMKGIFFSLGKWRTKREESRNRKLQTLADSPPPVLSDRALKIKEAIEAEEAKVAAWRAKAERASGDSKASSEDANSKLQARIHGGSARIKILKNISEMNAHTREGKERERMRVDAFCKQTGYAPPKNMAERSWRLGGGPLWFLPEKLAPWRVRDDPRGRQDKPPGVLIHMRRRKKKSTRPANVPGTDI